jgi:heme iron utilization protein
VDNKAEIAAEIRRLMQAERAYLGSLAERGGEFFPFVSLVVPALDDRNHPILLLSDLSDHASNLKANAKASLLFDGSLDRKEPLTGPRLTLLGRVEPNAEPEIARRYLAQRPAAELYAGFGDFRFYHFAPEEALYVAGFGKIHRLTGEDLAGALNASPGPNPGVWP